MTEMFKFTLLIALLHALVVSSAYASNHVKPEQMSIVRASILEFKSDSFYYDGKKVGGSIGERFQCALDHSGFRYTMEQLPLARQFLLMNEHNLDVAFAWQPTRERDQIAKPSEAVHLIKYGVVTTRDDITSTKSLEGLTISAPRKSNWIEMLKGFKAYVDETNGYEIAIKKAIHERTHGTILPYVSIQDRDLSPAKYVPLGEYQIGFYVANNSRFQREILAGLNKGITHCKNRSAELN